MNFAIAYGGAIVTFLILDAIWILGVANSFYRKYMGELMREDFLMAPAILFYSGYVAILVYLFVVPMAETGNLSKLIISAALFGLAAYGAYDLTNYSLLKNWPLNVTIVDMVWGMFVTTATSLGGYYAVKYFG